MTEALPFLRERFREGRRTMDEAVRVVAVVGHAVVLGVVRLACQAASDLELVGDTAAVDETGPLIAREQPDVVVLDGELRGALDEIRHLRDRGFDGGVLVLSDRSDGTSVLDAMRVGADGYVVKAEGLRTVGSAIAKVAAGQRVVAPELERVAVSELGRVAKQAREGTAMRLLLSSREEEILVLLADGLTMRQIGRRLAISPRTVETHVGKLYRKLGVRTRVQAVARAASLGLIELG